MVYKIFLPFDSFRPACVPKPFSKWVVIDLELRHFLVLVGGHGDELTFFEDVGSEGGVGQLENVAGPHKVEPGLVLVHRVQDRLSKKRGLEIVQKLIVWGYLLRLPVRACLICC